MKMLMPFLSLIAVGCAAHAQPAFTQPVPPPPPLEDVLIVAQAPAPAKARVAPVASAAVPAKPTPPDEASVIAGPRGSAVTWSSSAFKGYGLAAPSVGSRRTIVIPKGDPSPEFLTDTEEDLNVMTLILEKAINQRNDDDHKAMGIELLTSSSGVRNLLIEGHGAIFVLKTKIALVAPQAPKKEETKTKDTTSSEWEEAKQQIYGPSEIEREIHKKLQMNFGSSEEYDADKVQRLKDSLIEALKSASNIRHLSGDDTVTLVVLSSSPISEVRKIVTDIGHPGDKRRLDVYAKADREASSYDSRGGTRMTLQAKKSDIDSYAKGQLTTDAFRDKVKTQLY